MKLKGYYDITESGRYTVIFENENGEEWEVEFKIWITKEYIYDEIWRYLTDIDVTAKCTDPGFTPEEQVSMEVELEEYIYNNFDL